MSLSKKAIMVLQQWAVMNKQIPWQASEARGLFQKSLFCLLRKYIQLRKYITGMHQLNEIYYRKQICYFQNSHAE